MDPISQGALGAGLAQVKAAPAQVFAAGLLGAAAGMAPDLDVFIQSSTDPLLFLEYHRQFTHSLVFIPLGALLVAAVGFRFARSLLSFRQTYVFCLLGYATHALLDACTSYGTQLFWPFSNARVDWSNVSVVDPLFTLPLLLAVVLASKRAQPRLAWWGLAWAVGYLLLGAVQHDRAKTLALELADSRGLSVQRLEVKPAFANLLLWKSITEAQGRYYVDGLRVAIEPQIIPGQSVRKLDVKKHFPWLQAQTQQAQDVERFRWFSQDFLALHPEDPERVIDVRYSMLPNEISGLWSIRLVENADPEAHVGYETMRSAESGVLRRYYQLLIGDIPNAKSLPSDTGSP